MLESLDGKISTGDVDERDFDADLAQVPGIKEGLPQYYELEKLTDYFSFISGKVWAKLGFNTKLLEDVQKVPVCFVVVDNKPHLDAHGIEYIALRSEKLYLVTTNAEHLAYEVQKRHDNIVILHYDEKIDFANLFTKLHEEYGAKRVTIQSGGELNAVLLRAGLIDAVQIVVAPCLVGGRNTTTLIEGDSLRTTEDLTKICSLKLTSCKTLDDSYVVLDYEVEGPSSLRNT
jgi:2,5-diamino-6-(ribosylamino)-4(3H)-pyrimidinone 5'-phosphate reductase